MENKEYFDLFTELPVDTFLVVKFGSKFVKYNVPIERKNGSKRTFGNLYDHFTKREDFRFAIGYIRGETLDGYFSGQTQYFYFDRRTAPYLKSKRLDYPLLLKNPSHYKPK